MKSMFRDNKYPLLVLTLFFFVIPVASFLFDYEDGYDLYDLVDTAVLIVVRFAVFFLLLYHAREAYLSFEVHLRCAVAGISSRLQRKNGKKQKPLDRRDVRILLKTAEAAVLAGDDLYAETVMNNVRSSRKDLFLKDATLRYLHARCLFTIAFHRRETDGLVRYHGEMVRNHKSFGQLKKALYAPEVELFGAIVKLSEDPSDARIEKLVRTTTKALTPMRQAQGIHALELHYRNQREPQSAESCRMRLVRIAGDAAFMKAARCRVPGAPNVRPLVDPSDRKRRLRLLSGLLSCVWGVLFALNVATNLFYGAAPVGGWAVSAVAIVALGIFGSVKPVRSFATAGFIAVFAFLAFSFYVSFDYDAFTRTVRLSPAAQAAAVSGLSFDLGTEGNIDEINAYRVDTIVPMQFVTIDYYYGHRFEETTVGIRPDYFLTRAELEAAHGGMIPAKIRAFLDDFGNDFMLVNVSAGTVNPATRGTVPELFVLVEWDGAEGQLRCYRYILF